MFATIFFLMGCETENENLPSQSFSITISKIDPVSVVVKGKWKLLLTLATN